MEKELYSQFIILLNSKKEAIRKYNTNKNQIEELFEKEKDKNRKLNEENKKLQLQIEELKKQMKSNKFNQMESPKNGYSNNNNNSNNYQTPRKQSKNVTSFDAEDLLEDLSFE
ncbi:predicted protein [Naegleria gruberi]|uniref:Predicted protein n=1 Tax=Naegleria gruberi TaxID=5762 RepID=D2VM57_NAEGR|nr:uncharacterized protein NAEGRDRAFT_70018 [Naegleria gruberi]EFC42169.1 predicted protein [Naegleria gruberi]|eukprot:XP_002674913.1 predicted protein [Naegleria gruberi strain NEG-M]